MRRNIKVVLCSEAEQAKYDKYDVQIKFMHKKDTYCSPLNVITTAVSHIKEGHTDTSSKSM